MLGLSLLTQFPQLVRDRHVRLQHDFHFAEEKTEVQPTACDPMHKALHTDGLGAWLSPGHLSGSPRREMAYFSHLHMTGTRRPTELWSRCSSGLSWYIQSLFIGVTGSRQPGTLEFSEDGACDRADNDGHRSPFPRGRPRLERGSFPERSTTKLALGIPWLP
jgi:hypothetical protein